MKTYEYIRKNDIDAYKKLVTNFGFNIEKNIEKKRKKSKSNIELGDSVINLMSHDSYKRIGRRVKQTRWR